MEKKKYIAFILILLSLIPLTFLIYTLTNLQKLNISIFHPRIFVELIIFIIMLISGLLIIKK